MMLTDTQDGVKSRRKGDHTITRALWISAMLMAVCTMALSAAILFHFSKRHAGSIRNVKDVELFRSILDAATALAAERGPANSAMGEDPSGLPEKLANLTEARLKTDLGMRTLSQPAGPDGSQSLPLPLLERLKARLALARAKVDAALAKPHATRTYADIQSAIEGMISASDMMDDCVQWYSTALIARDADLATPVVGGQILSQLRDYTGRIASHVIAPVVVGVEMPMKNQIESRMTRGRVVELLRLLNTSIAAYPHEAGIARRKLLFEQLFFRQGLPLVDRVIEEGRNQAAYTMSAAELSRAYVPTIRPIEDVRSSFLSAAVTDLYQKEKLARGMLLAVSLGTLMIIFFFIGIAAAVHVFLFGPLLRASSMVIDLADGRDFDPPAKPWRGAEMRRLYGSLQILSRRMAEWSALMKQLKTEVDTDGMTGLLNRAAFDRLARNRGMLDYSCLILIDIDHFKSINDRFGHPAGDNVIRGIGDVLRRELADRHLAARFGGEEFAILHRGGLSLSTALCERLRQGIASMTVEFDGRPLPQITASFGIASYREDRFEDLVRRADAALYRAKGEGRNRVCIGL